MTDKNSNIFYLAPPNEDDFHRLFIYFWNQGIGRPVNNGVQIPWNKYDLESEFLARGKNIEVRTIENWKSGQSVPHVRNLLILSNIAAAGDKYNQKKWSEAFLKSYDKKRHVAKSAIHSENDQSNIHPQKSATETKRFISQFAAVGIISVIGLIFLLTIRGSNLNFGGESKTVGIASFLNQTANSDFDQLSEGLSALVIDSIYQIDNINVVRTLPPNSTTNKIDAVIECVFVGPADAYSIVCRIFDDDKQTVIWSRKFEFLELDNFKTIQNTLPVALAEVTGLALSDSALSRMKVLGTNDLEAFIAFQKGRKSLKHWHEDRTEDGMRMAFDQLSNASKQDPTWSEPKFQIVDIFHHFVSGDTNILDGFDKISAAGEVSSLLNAASFNSISAEEKHKAKMNAIFFSDNWEGLKEPSIKFVEAAVKRRGELEWLYEPIILSVLGDNKLFQDLLEKRMIKFDPKNGTVHAYKFRNYLLNNQSDKALIELGKTKVITFQNRIDEVKGFILFNQNRGQDLLDHATAENSLSPMYRDYFRALAYSINGKTKQAEVVLHNSSALAESKEYLAFAFLHLGDKGEAKDLLQQVSESPLGHVNIVSAIAYGAACGTQEPPLPRSILKKFLEAGIELPECVTAG